MSTRFYYAAARMHAGALAVLLGLAGLGLFDWRWMLIGWGSAGLALGFLELRSANEERPVFSAEQGS